MLVKCGAQPDNMLMLDRKGVIHSDRGDLNEFKARFARQTDKRTLHDVLTDADVFLGVSGPNLLPADALALMAPNPVVFACANPDPEITPELAFATR
ncbi:MAG: malic enzyme-like NAD(P)-binding protein, partial [Plesiomonas shigelloides]